MFLHTVGVHRERYLVLEAVMNRRKFLSLTVGALATAALVPYAAPAPQETFSIITAGGLNTLTYRGKRFVFDPSVQSMRVYFVNPDTLRVFTSDGVEILAQ